MSEKLILECYQNYLKASKNYKSDTWKETSSQNISFIKRKRYKNLLTNTLVKGLAPVDNYPTYNFLDKKKSKELSNLQDKEFFKLYKKNKYLDYDFAASYTIAFKYFNQFKKKINKNSKVLIIGDGYGILSSMILKTFKCKVFLCDLPETLIYQEYFLKNNLKNMPTQYISNAKDIIDYKKKIFFINADQIHNYEIKLDLIINTDSFGEMDKNTVKNYLDYAGKNLVKNGYFYYCNPVGLSSVSYNYPSDYPLSKSFEIEKIEVFHSTHRDTFPNYLSVLVKKKDFKKGYISSYKKKIIKEFYLNSGKILSKKIHEQYSKKIIKILNNDKKYKKTSLKKINLSKEYINKNKINVNNFYEYLFAELIDKLKNTTKKNFLNLIDIAKEFHKRKIEISSIVKLASLARFFSNEAFERIIKDVPENFFEVAFLKFCLYEKSDLNEQKRIIKILKKFKANHLFDLFKLCYAAKKIKNDVLFKETIKKILPRINGEGSAINFLKVLFMLGEFEVFLKYFKIYNLKFKLTDQDKIDIFLSTSFLNKETKERFKKFFKKKFFLKNKKNIKIGNLVFNYKIGLINEKRLIKEITMNFNDYYSIGFVLKNTINFLSKKNIKLLCQRSLKQNIKKQNLNFIGEIYFYNLMFKEVFVTLKKLDKIEKYSLFYTLKKNLSRQSILNQKNKIEISNLIKSDFFRVIHNGRTVILPFLCNGNNMVMVNNN